MAEVAGSNPGEPIVLFTIGPRKMTDDEHNEDEK
jgi:hypothetical protein